MRDNNDDEGSYHNGNDDDPDERLFSVRQQDGIRIPPKLRPKPSALAARGPVVLGMLAVGGALGLGVHAYEKLRSAGDSGPVVLPVVDAETDAPATIPAFLTLELGDPTTVVIDHRELGQWSGVIHLEISPGEHTIEGKTAGKIVTRRVFFTAGSEHSVQLAP